MVVPWPLTPPAALRVTPRLVRQRPDPGARVGDDMAERVRSVGLVGREHELGRIEKSLAAAAEGEPQVLLVAGDAGIGKTSIVRALVGRAQDAGFEVLEGHCLDIEAAIPFGPFVEAITPLLGSYARDAERPAAARAAAMLDPTRRSPDAEPAALMAALRQAMDEAAAHGPVLLVLEDMHWVDRSTQDLALSLARTASGPLLLALSVRTDELTRRHPSRAVLFEIGRSAGAVRMDLAPLDRTGVQAVVESATGQRADRDRVSELLARSEGNPLYVEELLAGRPDQIPGPLSDLLLARLDALSEPTRSLLCLASVGGSRIDADLVADVADLATNSVDELLEEAFDANVLVRDRDHLGFRHGLLRDAVYDDLLPSRRRKLHAAFARAVATGSMTLVEPVWPSSASWPSTGTPRATCPRRWPLRCVPALQPSSTALRRRPSSSSGRSSCGTRCPTPSR